MLIVEKFPWANTLDVTRGVDAALDELRPGLAGIDDRHDDLPAGRPSSRCAIDNLTRALLLGCLLVVLVLCAFLFEWRTALISLVAIPLSLVTAVLVLYWRGATINTMILAGLVIARRRGGRRRDHRRREHRAATAAEPARRQRRDRSPPVILEASLEVRSAIIYATLIIVVARACRCFFMDGLSGAFFRRWRCRTRSRSGVAGRGADASRRRWR